MTRLLFPLVLVLGASCSNTKPTDWGDGSEDTHDTSETGDTDTGDTDTGDTDSGDTHTGDTETGDTHTGDTDTGIPDNDAPGDIIPYADDGSGVSAIDLTDASGDSNRDQEFYLLAINTGLPDLGYRLRYYPADSRGLPPPPAIHPPPLPPRPVHRDTSALVPAMPPPPPALSPADIGTASKEYLVREDLYDDSSTGYATIAATLWAYGDNIAIWVDNDAHIDWDIDCDGVVDVPDPYDAAYGFDNCDLNEVVRIVDDNIVPNLRSYFGDESDINGDGRIAVVISPVLNTITLTSANQADHYKVLSSYTEPSVDLNEFNYRTNPGSDEEEVVYVYAPDPYGYYNPYAKPSVDTFTGFTLAAEIARSTTALISYNQHVFVGAGPVENDWVNNAMGTLGADLCGFGAGYYLDAWEYLDAPHLTPLVSEDVAGSLETLSHGAQYLFARWLYDRAEATSPGSGVGMLQDIVQGGHTGVESITYATGADFTDLVLGWQVALLTYGITKEDGSAMLPAADWPTYADPTTISAPPSSPGDHYGANGYQLGVSVHGVNRSYQGGTTDSPSELPVFATKMENQDAWLYTPGFEFNGFISGGYGADVVRLNGVTYDEAMVELQATGPGIVGAVVRWNDPHTLDYSVEDIYSVTDANAILLPSFPSDGSKITGEGQLSGTSDVTAIDPDNSTSTATAVDTDRWMLDLSSRSPADTVNVAVWISRHFSDTNGSSGPLNPWVAVVPVEMLPEPTHEGTHTNDACGTAPEFDYPTSMLSYLFAQQVLSPVMISGNESALAIPGTITSPECGQDWDLDGVADADEPQPTTLMGQILVQQYTLNGNAVPSNLYPASWMDMDEQDDDDRYTANVIYNVGGRAGQEGEEGYVQVPLRGGQQYIIVVGAGDLSNGTYEVHVRELR